MLDKSQDIIEVVERLTPWARGLAFFKLDVGEVKDGVATMRAKAAEVCLEIAQGSRSQPKDLDAYIKRVMANALTDLLRKRQENPRPLKPQELEPYARLLGDVDEGDEQIADALGWQGLRSPAKPDATSKRIGSQRQHFLARFLAFVAQQDLYQSLQDKYRQSTQQVGAIPDDRVRTMVTLYFQGHEQAAIARKLSLSRAAVSQALRRHLAAWGLDEPGAKLVRYAWLYVSLEKAVMEGCKAAGTCYDPPEPEFELPDSFISALPARLRHGWPNRRSGPRVRTVEQYSAELCLTEEREVYKAIKDTPCLEPWTNDLGQEDVRDIIEASEPLDPWDEYDDSTWLDLP